MAASADPLLEKLSLHLQFAGADVVPMEQVAAEHTVALSILPPAEGSLTLSTALCIAGARWEQERARFLHPASGDQLLGHLQRQRLARTRPVSQHYEEATCFPPLWLHS